MLLSLLVSKLNVFKAAARENFLRLSDLFFTILSKSLRMSQQHFRSSESKTLPSSDLELRQLMELNVASKSPTINCKKMEIEFPDDKPESIFKISRVKA